MSNNTQITVLLYLSVRIFIPEIFDFKVSLFSIYGVEFLVCSMVFGNHLVIVFFFFSFFHLVSFPLIFINFTSPRRQSNYVELI